MPINTVFFDLGDTLVLSQSDWVPGAKTVLATLRAMNVRLGLISNTGQLSRTQLMQLLPADFDLAVFEPALVLFSSEVGVQKPSLEIFQLAVQRTAAAASQNIYCSENLTETLTAQRAGMIAARVQKPPASDVSVIVASFQEAGLLV